MHHYRLERSFRYALQCHKADASATPFDEKTAAAVISAVSKRVAAGAPFDMPAFEKFDVDGAATAVGVFPDVRAHCVHCACSLGGDVNLMATGVCHVHMDGRGTDDGGCRAAILRIAAAVTQSRARAVESGQRWLPAAESTVQRASQRATQGQGESALAAGTIYQQRGGKGTRHVVHAASDGIAQF